MVKPEQTTTRETRKTIALRKFFLTRVWQHGFTESISVRYTPRPDERPGFLSFGGPDAEHQVRELARLLLAVVELEEDDGT